MSAESWSAWRLHYELLAATGPLLFVYSFKNNSSRHFTKFMEVYRTQILFVQIIFHVLQRLWVERIFTSMRPFMIKNIFSSFTNMMHYVRSSLPFNLKYCYPDNESKHMNYKILEKWLHLFSQCTISFKSGLWNHVNK